MRDETQRAIADVASTPQIDPGLSALVAAIITGIVALVGHRVAISKNKTEKSATQVEGFERLTTGLQTQVDALRGELDGVKSELAGLKVANHTLSTDNQNLRSEVQTKSEVIRGFTRWLVLWEDWFNKISQEFEQFKGHDIDDPPEYTWQMRQYLAEVEQANEDSRRIMETGKDN